MSGAFKIRKFDLDNIEDGKVIVAIGKRKSGKSYCMKDFLYHKRHIPVARIISGTERANNFYGTIAPPAFISFEYNEDIIEKFLTRQRELKIKKNNPYYKNMDSRAILLLDDLMFDKDTWIKSRNVKEMFMNGRHYDITFIITLQYSLGIPPALRNNTDYIFIFRENRIAERRKLYDHWAGVIPTFELFNDLMDKVTNDYGCLVIDNACTSNKLEEQVFWYKAMDRGAFKMCDARAWTASANRQVDVSSEQTLQPAQKKYNIILKNSSSDGN